MRRERPAVTLVRLAGERQPRQLLGFELELMPGNPRVLPVHGESFMRQDLEHPGPEAGVLVVAVEGGKGPHDRVLQGIRRFLRLPNQPPAIRFQLVLDWLEQRQETVRLICGCLTHSYALYRSEERRVGEECRA